MAQEPDSAGVEEMPQFEGENQPQKSCKSKCIKFLTSYFGLMVLLILYSVGGAFYFSKSEGALEQKSYEKMLTDHQALNESAHYLAEFFSDLHFSKLHSINNCTHLSHDPCYMDVKKDGYFAACGSSECYKTEFCTCVRNFRANFEENVVDIL